MLFFKINDIYKQLQYLYYRNLHDNFLFLFKYKAYVTSLTSLPGARTDIQSDTPFRMNLIPPSTCVKRISIIFSIQDAFKGTTIVDDGIIQAITIHTNPINFMSFHQSLPNSDLLPLQLIFINRSNQIGNIHPKPAPDELYSFSKSFE